jgi:GNAT superfamily N-acetyltransferase
MSRAGLDGPLQLSNGGGAGIREGAGPDRSGVGGGDRRFARGDRATAAERLLHLCRTGVSGDRVRNGPHSPGRPAAPAFWRRAPPLAIRSSMSWRIDIPEAPTAEHRQAVLEPLAEFNEANGYPADSRPLAVLLKDEAGVVVGGLWGKTGYGWLFVEFLVVPEALRGRDAGTALMDSAESMAMERGCVGAWLTTFAFQARAFYEKRGYSLFGELEQSPGDNVRLFLRKLF